MRREVITTADGSVTLRLPDWDETYHSKHGAIQEAEHVFISSGLKLFEKRPVNILEIGFGTGLNCFLTFLHTREWNVAVKYTGVEAYPVSQAEVSILNYSKLAGEGKFELQFQVMHSCDWETPVAISDTFLLTKLQMKFEDLHLRNQFDLIYFDAFGYNVQPELWSEEIFRIMYDSLRKGGVLVTYAARTLIRRNLKSVGFSVETLAGPPGKREMTRATKN